MANILSKFIRRRFALLQWPAECLRERVEATRGNPISEVNDALYPVRTSRFWWVHNAILDEKQARQESLTIADFGCSGGGVKHYIGSDSEEKNGREEKWIGLDWKIDATLPQLSGYDSLGSVL